LRSARRNRLSQDLTTDVSAAAAVDYEDEEKDDDAEDKVHAG